MKSPVLVDHNCVRVTLDTHPIERECACGRPYRLTLEESESRVLGGPFDRCPLCELAALAAAHEINRETGAYAPLDGTGPEGSTGNSE